MADISFKLSGAVYIKFDPNFLVIIFVALTHCAVVVAAATTTFFLKNGTRSVQLIPVLLLTFCHYPVKLFSSVDSNSMRDLVEVVDSFC